MSKKLWGGRFTKKIDKDFFEFQKSIGYDYKLAEHDIAHSTIHVYALKEAGVLDGKETKKLMIALEEVNKNILHEIESGQFKADDSEDIHTEIQNRIEKKVGNLALKLHTLRSRNDQVVFDEKYYCWTKATQISKHVLDMHDCILMVAEKNKKSNFIGYTHTQRAQVIKFADYISAYGYMLLRDVDRLQRFADRLDIFIGAGALTGTSLTRSMYNAAINKTNFSKIKPVKNALDTVSDRDFLIEFLSILSIIQMHLSRMAEDFILYSTKEFDLLDLPEEFCTGSSLMPHKKNADFLELVRGYTGRVYGNLFSVLTTMKGLPLTYNRDMQLDKEPLFSSVEIVSNELKLIVKFIDKIKINKDAVNKILEEDITLYATEMAEWLVLKSKAKEPFKTAHDIVGKLVILIEKNHGKIENITEPELKRIHQELNHKIIRKVMNAKYAISSKKTASNTIKKLKK